MSESIDSIFSVHPAIPELDSTFGGGDGVSTAPNPPGGTGTNDAGKGLAIDSFGRIYVVGDSLGTTLMRAFICRLTTAGNLDSTFGSDGCSTTEATSGVSFHDHANSVIVDGSDEPVVTGESRADDFSAEDMVVWRYLDDGSLDTGFGSGGAFTTTSAAPSPQGRDAGGIVNVGSGGEILVAGSSRGGAAIYFALWAVAATGSGLMSGFPRTDAPASQTGATGVLQHSNGNYVVTGYATDGSDCTSPRLWHYATDGTPQGGSASNLPGGMNEGGLGAVVEDSGTTVIVAGTTSQTCTTGPDVSLTLWRYTLGSPSTLDPAWASSGIAGAPHAVSGFNYDIPTAMAIDSSGRIVIAAQSTDLSTSYTVVWRFLANGSLDTTWGGGNSYVVFPSATGASAPNDYPSALRIDSSGRYVIAGRSEGDDGNMQIVVWRVNP